MRKKWLLLVVSLVIVACIVIVGCTPGEKPGKTDGEVVKLKMQSAFPRGDVGMGALTYFAEAANEFSDGTLEIEVFAEPEIVSMFETPDALTEGLLDLYQGHGAIWPGRGVHVGEIEFCLPYGYVIPEKESFDDKWHEQDRFFDDGFADLLREEYAKVGMYWLGKHTNGPVPFLVAPEKTAQAFQGTLEDIKGLVIRSDALFMIWHEKVGMTGVEQPGSEAYTGLQTGTFDANIWDMSGYLGMGFEEVAPYWVRGMENDHVVCHIVVNLDVWEGLTEKQQQALHKANDIYAQKCLELYGDGLKELQEKINNGIIYEVYMSDEILAAHQEAAYEIWEEAARTDDACARAIEMFKEWRGIK